MRNEWRNQRELEDKHAFLYTLDRDEVRSAFHFRTLCLITYLNYMRQPLIYF